MKRYLETERLRLVALRPQQAPITLRYYKENQAYLEKYEEKKETAFFTEIYQQAMLKAENLASEKGSSIRYWIFLKADLSLESPIGSLALSQIVRGPFQSCFVGYKTDYRYVNNGYMTEALKCLMDYAFVELGLHRIEASVMPSNQPSLRVLEKLGFQKEGYSKAYLKINGKWEDHIRLALLNEAEG